MPNRTQMFPTETFLKHYQESSDPEDIETDIAKTICYMVDGDAWHYILKDKDHIAIEANEGLHFHNNGALTVDSLICDCNGCIRPEQYDIQSHYHIRYQISLGERKNRTLPRIYDNPDTAAQAAKEYMESENFIAKSEHHHCDGGEYCPTPAMWIPQAKGPTGINQPAIPRYIAGCRRPRSRGDTPISIGSDIPVDTTTP